VNDYELLSKKKQVLFVGRIEIEPKRPDLLLLIWQEIHMKFPDWELIILGDGPDRPYIEKCAYQMNLQNVSFKGIVNPEPFYKNASIICMTSDYEGFPLVLIEAMQYGVVPITFNNWASLQDLIFDDQTGLLVNTADIKSYTNRLADIMKNDNVRNRIARNAINQVQKLDIKEIGRQWLNLFDEIIVRG
jgi:glycosyltransferase involved in cell wall biosynthesis